MALDLSGVNGTQSEDNVANTLYSCVVLTSEVVSLPGTNEILFYISDVGHLILANFLVENVNGNYFLKKYAHTTTNTLANGGSNNTITGNINGINGSMQSLVEENLDMPTNLCLDKSEVNKLDKNEQLIISNIWSYSHNPSDFNIQADIVIHDTTTDISTDASNILPSPPLSTITTTTTTDSSASFTTTNITSAAITIMSGSNLTTTSNTTTTATTTTTAILDTTAVNQYRPNDSNVSELEIELTSPEQPLDATLSRLESDGNLINLSLEQSDFLSSSNENSRVVQEIQHESNILGRIVNQLIEDHKMQKYDHINNNSNDNHNMNNGNNDSHNSDIIIQGHNLSELERFVKQLRKFRQQYGLSQIQLSQELTKHYNNKPMFSQTLLSRFEKLNVTVRSAYRLLPYLQRWISHVEQKQCGKIISGALPVFYQSVPVRAVGKARLTALTRLGAHINDEGKLSVLALTNKQQPKSDMNMTHLEHSDATISDSELADSACKLQDPQRKRRRRKRTCFSSEALSLLTRAYAKNPRPTSSELTRLAQDIEHDRESVRFWFYNRRRLDRDLNAKIS